MSAANEVKAFLATFNATRKANEDAWWHDQLLKYYEDQQANTPAGMLKAAEKNLAGKRPAAFTAGPGNGAASATPVAAKGPVADYIRQAAEKRGIDPSVALKVAQSEGLNTYAGDKTPDGTPTSFGPFQLHYGEVAKNGPFRVRGLGDDFTAATGLDARDPKTINAQVDFALDHAAKNGWGAWYGAKNVGITGKMGINGTTVPTKTAAGAVNLSKLSDADVAAANARNQPPAAEPSQPASGPAIPPPEAPATPMALPAQVSGEPAPGPSAFNQDELNPDYWNTAQANMAIPEYTEYAARGGMIRRFADGGLVDEESNAKYWTEQNNAPQTAPQLATQALPVTPAAPEPAKASPGQPDMTGLPKLLDMGIRALQRGLGFGDSASALPQGDPNAGLQAFHSSAGAMTPQEYGAVRKATDPNNVLAEPVAKIQVMREMADHFYARGEPEKAQASIASIIQYSLQVSKAYGKSALSKLQSDDPEGAAKDLEKGANNLPAGHEVKLDPKTLQFVIKDVRTGKELQRGALTHQTLVEAALGMASGGEGFKQLMKVAAEHDKSDNEPSTAYAAKLEAARSGKPAGTPTQAIPAPGVKPAVGPMGTTPASMGAPAAGTLPGAKPAVTGEDDDEEDTPATPAAVAPAIPGPVAGAPAVETTPAAATPASVPVAPPATALPPVTATPPAARGPSPIGYEPASLPKRDPPALPPPPDDPTDKGQKAQYAAAMTDYKARAAEYNKQRSEDAAAVRAETAQARLAAVQRQTMLMREQAATQRAAGTEKSADRRQALSDHNAALRQKSQEEAEIRKEVRASRDALAKQFEDQTKPAEFSEEDRQKYLPPIQAQLNQVLAAGQPEEVKKKLPQQFYGAAAKVDMEDPAQAKSLADDPEIRKTVGEANHQAMSELALQIYRYQPSIGIKNAVLSARALTMPQRETGPGEHTSLPFEITPIGNPKTGAAVGGIDPRVLISFDIPGVTAPNIVVPKSMLNVARTVRGDLADKVDKQESGLAQEQAIRTGAANDAVGARAASQVNSAARTVQTNAAAGKRMLSGVSPSLGGMRTVPEGSAAQALPVGEIPAAPAALPGRYRKSAPPAPYDTSRGYPTRPREALPIGPPPDTSDVFSNIRRAYTGRP